MVDNFENMLKFKNKIQFLLGEETDKFFESLDTELKKGIRYNPLKIDENTFVEKIDFLSNKIDWCKEGFYLSKDTQKPGKHPYYFAGLYYLQEPSAMIPVEVLDVKPGDRVLDISAAPGGKSTQIGAKLQGEGFLVCNDISPKRAIALEKNISLFGIKNTIVFNQKPEVLKNIFPNFFNKVLVDAPCSGEGLIKKDFKNYEPDNLKYVNMQKEILKSVERMVSEGGELVYSTCTFSQEENEGVIDWFINTYKDFEIIELNIDCLSCGLPESVNGHHSLKLTGRAWPHRLEGEGHFIAKLKRKQKTTPNPRFEKFQINFIGKNYFIEFADEIGLDKNNYSNIHSVNDTLYLIPDDFVDIGNLKFLNSGLKLGDIKNNKFFPSQELALSLTAEDVNRSVMCSNEDINVVKYLKGETIEIQASKGWNLFCVDGFGLGWGKGENSVLKNYYKKQWRML